MGDRAVIVIKSAEGDVGPAVYLHWNGSDAPALLQRLKALMTDREGDVSYATARLIGLAHEMIPGNLSLGVFALKPDEVKAIRRGNVHDMEAISHGDAGLIVVDASTFDWTAYRGYLAGQRAAA